MSWKLRHVELYEGKVVGTDRHPMPGEWWWTPWLNRLGSPHYTRDWEGRRDTFAICLPDGVHWMPDRCAANLENGWAVGGESGNWTARPSILSVCYHGYLTNGELSDDVDGKVFPDHGYHCADCAKRLR